jgi:hypothetical protein
VVDRINAVCLRFVQAWIADPLQFSGISLNAQIQGACIVIVLGWVGSAADAAARHAWAQVTLNVLIVMMNLKPYLA